MRRSTAATLAMTCMGTIAGVAASSAAGGRGAAAERAQLVATVADRVPGGTAAEKRSAASRYSRRPTRPPTTGVPTKASGR